MNIAKLLSTVAEVAGIVGPLLPAGGLVADAIKLATNVAIGVANAEPAIETLYQEIKAAAAGSEPPTAAQWAEWNGRADEAHARLNAALDETGS